MGDEVGGFAALAGVAELGGLPVGGAGGEVAVADRGVQGDDVAEVGEPGPVARATVSPARSSVRPLRRVFLVTTTSRPPGRSTAWQAAKISAMASA